MNNFLLCNRFVSLNKRDIVIDAVKSHQKNKTSNDKQEVIAGVVTETSKRSIEEKFETSPMRKGGTKVIPVKNMEIYDKRLLVDNAFAILVSVEIRSHLSNVKEIYALQTKSTVELVTLFSILVSVHK